jgi:hypothetical protein
MLVRTGDTVLGTNRLSPPPAPGFSISTSFRGGSAMTKLA